MSQAPLTVGLIPLERRNKKTAQIAEDEKNGLRIETLFSGRDRFPGGFEQALQEYGVVTRAVPRLSRIIRIFARGNPRVPVGGQTYTATPIADQSDR